MARSMGALTTVNTKASPGGKGGTGGGVVMLQLPRDWNGGGALHYGSVGADWTTAATGTIILEASANYNEVDPSPPLGKQDGYPGDWYQIAMVDPAASPGTAITTLSSPNHIGIFESVGYTWLRARMTVAGGAQGVWVSLSVGLF